jgi:hypothetical protein
MSDQAAPIEAPEATPDTGTPEATEAPSAEQKDVFEQRYNELRPQYDRTQNELHRYQNDPAFREQLFNELATEFGYEMEGEPEDEYIDPDEAVQRELQELKQWRNEFVEQQQLQQQAAIAEHYSENKMTELGIPDVTDRSLPPEIKEQAELQRNWIVTRAMALPGIQDQSGNIVPNVEAAFQEFRRLVPQAPEPRPEVPFTPQGGQENTGVPALSSDPVIRSQQREQIMLQKLESMRGM